MSAYTTIANVRKVMPGGASLSELTTPNLADVTGWITSVSAEVDVVLGIGGFTIPVTDTATIDMLDIRAAREVAYQVMTARGAWAPGTSPPFWAKWHDEFEAMLKSLSDGEGASADTVVGSAGMPWCYTMDAAVGVEDSEVMDARIQRKDKW